MSQFVHLHLHTQYSLLDGVNKIPGVIKQAAAMGQPAIAITDHGNMHGAIEFYSACKEEKIKPVIGCEFYITPESRFEKSGRQEGIHHLTVLAKNQDGYQNLCRLISRAYKEGFYYKPRIDHELLEEYHQGLIVLSGCLNSEVGELVKTEQVNELKQRIEWYGKLFKKDYYLEVQPHPIKEQRKQNNVLEDYARSLGIGMVATTDCHYPSMDHHYAQEILMCISTGKNITDPDRLKHDGITLHLKSFEEMQTEFQGVKFADEALKNTLAIAEKCELEFEFGKHYMPRYEAPKGKTLREILREQSNQGLEQRIKVYQENGDWNESNRGFYQERLDEELNILIEKGFPGYFLVVADFINWAKENNIPVGPGRGSAAGSLVAYALRITEVDPIVHNLLFERFLNPERKSMPDIDVDFCITGRDDVIKYVVGKYGAEKVAQIATFGTLKAKAAIKDVGRALGFSYAETDRIAKLIPAPRQGFDYPLTEALKMEPRLAEYAKSIQGKELIDLALKLEGLNRHVSTHAAGVVIGDRDLSDMLPMMVDKDGKDVTQYSMKYVEKIGLVKFDFLGLKTLTVIDTAIKLIKSSQDLKLDPNTFPLDDSRTYSMLCAGNTTGVFQLESSGIKDMTMRLKPSCFDDLVAILALYRPGPLDAGMVDHYINRKHGREDVAYLHPDMKEILKDTYGIIVYQEQIMQLAQKLAGYSLGEADLLRRAMGKKVPAEMAAQRERFMQGALAYGLNERLAAEIFDQMETFARYGFNRSHSAAYAMISFQTAYLRAHYPVEFMAALMSHEMGDSDKVLKNMTECRQHKITVLPPDVNKSISGFNVDGKNIRFGLSAVKGVGEKAVLEIIKARKDQPFTSFEDLVGKVDLQSVNKRVLENLIRCGAFDFTGLSRNELSERLEPVMRAGQALQKTQNTNQISLFSDEQMNRTIPVKTSKRAEWPINQKLAYEREALGFYLSGHPIEKFSVYLQNIGVRQIQELKNIKSDKKIRVGGVVTALKLKNTKKGNRYASLVFEDMTGTIESLVWPDTYLQVAQVLHSEDPVIATGRVDSGDERAVFIIENLESLLDVRDRRATQGVLTFHAEDNLEEAKTRFLEILSQYPGNVPVKVLLDFDGEQVQLVLKSGDSVPVSVRPSEELCDAMEELFGRPVLSFV